MDESRLPSLTALRSFALVVECGSLSGAARAMNVTQPAVTQQVRALERHLDTKLVKRHGRGILLTDDGQILAQYLQRGFDELRRGVRAVSERTSPRIVRVTTSPSFAAYWLVPRVSAFQAAHPGISIQLDLSAEPRSLAETNFDLAIRYCRDADLPRGISPLLEVTLNVLCHRSLAPPKPWTGKVLQNLPWLQELGVSVVKDWFRRQDIGDCVPTQISEMPGNLIIEAIKRGEAVAYSVCDWVAADLERGDLVNIWDRPEKGYYYAISDEPNTACTAFLRFLLKQAAM